MMNEFTLENSALTKHYNRRLRLLSSRRMSNLLCGALVLLPILSKLFQLPVTYLLYFFGADIAINFYTGLVTVSEFALLVINTISRLAAITAITVIIAVFYAKPLSKAPIFKAPHRGVTILALPMSLFMMTLGLVLAVGFTNFLEIFGIVLPLRFFEMGNSLGENAALLLIALIGAVLQEILFRGVILNVLRKFGDSFAIIVCAILYAIFSYSASLPLYHFLFGLSLCYFAIRAGSVVTPIICRVVATIIIFSFSFLQGNIEQSLFEFITLLLLVLILFFAIAAYVKFIKQDKRAFYLHPDSDGIETSSKVLYFCSGLLFIFLVVFFYTQIQSTIQIIG